MYSVAVNSFEEWRVAAREYLSANISPQQIQWLSGQQAGVFDGQVLSIETNASNNSSKNELKKKQKGRVAVPSAFLLQLKQASNYIGNVTPEAKWALFYSLLWRVSKINRDTLLLKSDSEVQQLERMVKSVNRDMHKMKAFVRFKTDSSVFDDIGSAPNQKQSSEYYTAWFEPEHAIVNAIAPFFVKRFTGMKWSILTPYGCAHWDQHQLILSPGIRRPDIREDEFDSFWRVYYRNIFNPARLKQQAMRSEMPKKYWKYLPESICIHELASGSAARVDNMINAESTNSERVRQQSKQVTEFQDQLRRQSRL